MAKSLQEGTMEFKIADVTSWSLHLDPAEQFETNMRLVHEKAMEIMDYIESHDSPLYPGLICSVNNDMDLEQPILYCNHFGYFSKPDATENNLKTCYHLLENKFQFIRNCIRFKVPANICRAVLEDYKYKLFQPCIFGVSGTPIPGYIAYSWPNARDDAMNNWRPLIDRIRHYILIRKGWYGQFGFYGVPEFLMNKHIRDKMVQWRPDSRFTHEINILIISELILIALGPNGTDFECLDQFWTWFESIIEMDKKPQRVQDRVIKNLKVETERELRTFDPDIVLKMLVGDIG